MTDIPAEIHAAGEFESFPAGECSFRAANLSLAIGDTLVLSNASFSLQKGHCYGLIGPNGAGKTTLLTWLRSVLQQQNQDDSDAKSKSKSADESGNQRYNVVKYVGQNEAELSAECSLSILEYVIAGDERRAALEAIVDDIQPDDALSAERLGEALMELEVDDTEERARKILRKLYFDDIERPVSSLSGGWRSRLEIARALCSSPDILLLDEPTNHLDIEAVLQLGSILRKVHGDSARTVVVVSHDAAFLDFVSTDIICVHKQTVQQIPGNYDNFEEKAEQYRIYHENLYDKRQKEEDRVHRSIGDQKAHARRTGDEKALRNAGARRKKAEKRVGLYREDGKRYKLNSLKELSEDALRLPSRAEAVTVDGELTLKLPHSAESVARSGRPLLTTGSLEVGYPGTKKGVVLRVGDVQVYSGARIAVVGRNGCGKSTLLRTLVDDRHVVSGNIRREGRVALLDQNQLARLGEHLDVSAVEFLHTQHPSHFKDATEAHQYLGRFGLGGAVATVPIAALSGGLRVRLTLADMFVAAPSVLLLDEPTNHLDGESIIALGNALEKWPGAVVAVSHNCAFLVHVFRSLWVCDAPSPSAAAAATTTPAVLSVRTPPTPDRDGFVSIFEAYAATLVKSRHREVLKSMLRTRAARSAVIVQQPRAVTSLLV